MSTPRGSASAKAPISLRRATRRAARRALRDAAGWSALEVMLALVILSTAIIGAAAAQAGAWRVVSGSRNDSEAWAALHQQAEELISLGYDNVASGYKTVSGHPIQWTVSGVDPKVVLVVTQRQVGPAIIADTLQILLRDEAP